MHRFRSFVFLFLVSLLAGCSGSDGGGSPTAPSASTPSRIIGLSGNLAFGSVDVGSTRESTLTISNSGTQPLTVTGMTVTGGLSEHTRASWTSGTIPAGGSQPVRITFEPRSSGSFSGTLAVNGDHTGGVNTIPVSGTGAGVTAAGRWSGRYVVERCDGTGSVQDLFCSANRGIYPAGSALPITLVLTQSGGSVAGTIAFGQVTGVVNGAVSPGGTLSLQGTALSGDMTLTITTWNTPIAGDSLVGTISFNVGFRTVPGVAGVAARLSNVTR